MFLHIDPSDGLAIYEQVVRQVKFAVANGTLKPGDLAPSVRQLSRELAINPNTVTRAYRQLQADGVLQSVRGTGVEVAPGAVELCRSARVQLIRGRVRRALVEAKQSQLSADAVRGLVERELAQLDQEEQPR
jgi:GntR family transcriptional regulator